MTSPLLAPSRTFAVLLCGVLLISCSEEKKAPPSAPAPKEARWEVDPGLEKQLLAIAKECTIDVKRADVKCQDGRDKTLIRELLSDKYKRLKSLETFVSLLESKDEKVKVASAAILYEATRGGLEEKAAPGSVSKKVAEALRRQMVDSDPQIARQLAPAAAHASALAGDLNQLYTALEGNMGLAAAAYRFVMVYGRLDAFPQIQKMAQSPQSGVRLAALEAPRNMRRWTPKDRAAICPWAVSLLEDKRPMVASRAAALLTRCSGDYVDSLLKSGETALAAGKFSQGDLPPYRDLCSGMRKREGGGVTTEQCSRNRDLLSDVLDSKDLDEQTRALALSAIAYQWPDADSLKLAERYAKVTKDSSLKVEASRTVSRLTSRLEAEKKSPTTGTVKVEGLAAPESPREKSPAATQRTDQ